tara:strand:+ start:566 stop:2122 length:1557 start_codon:yes stop_codon:yes gene_type:complete
MKNSGKNKDTKYLQKRDNLWYLRKRLKGGRTILKSLETSDHQEAKKRRNRELKKLELGEDSYYNQIDSKKAKHFPTVQELVDCYLDWAQYVNEIRKGPNPQTAQGNVNVFLRVLCARYGFQPNSCGKSYDVPEEIANLPLSVVNGDLPLDYDHYSWKHAKGRKDDSLKVTINSNIRKSAALFSSKSKAPISPLEWYEKQGLALPDSVKDFVKAAGKYSLRAAAYQKPPQNLIDKTFAAAEILKRENPAVGAAFVLCYDLGLRAGEAAWCRWDWFELREDGNWTVNIKKITQVVGQEKGFKGPKASTTERPGRTIAIPAETAQWLNDNVRVEQVARPEQPKVKKTKIDFEQAEEIRRRFAEGGVTKLALAKEFGVSNVFIAKVISGEKWKAPLGKRELPEDAGEYVLPGLTFTDRYKGIIAELNAWLRDLGWTKEPGPGHNGFEKAAHELRKLKGSEYYCHPELGAVQARNFLGHSSVVTTETYYAALGRDQVKVCYPQVLRTKAANDFDSFFQHQQSA